MEDRREEPPPAPRIRRRLETSPGQALGLLFIFAIPIAALLGAFGESRTAKTLASEELEIRIRHPERLRYKQIDRITVAVTNRSAAPLDTVRVSFDPAYILRFSQPQFVPAADQAFTVALTNLGPGVTGLATVTIQGERYGRQAGPIRITTRRDTLTARLATFVFP